METDPGADEAPVGHAVHALAPVVIEYVPPRHKTHVLTLLAPDIPEYDPELQFTHAAVELAPTVTE
jgi:hypothetical protein